MKYNPAKEPTQASTDETCLLRATPACCDFAHLTLRISQHRSASSQRKPRYRLCTSFLVLPTSSEICPRAYVRESNPRDKRRGLLVLPSASCSATPQRSRPKPQQPHPFAPRYASTLYICRPRTPHFTSIAPRAASACLGTVSAPLFWCFRPARNYAPGQAYWNRDGIISDQESPFCRFAEGPNGPRDNLRQGSGRSSRDIVGTTGAGPSGLIIPSAPGVRAWAAPVCPFPAKTGGSRWVFCRDYFFSSSSIQTVYMGLSTGVYFTSTTAGWNDWGSFSPGSTELTLQPHQGATA